MPWRAFAGRWSNGQQRPWHQFFAVGCPLFETAWHEPYRLSQVQPPSISLFPTCQIPIRTYQRTWDRIDAKIQICWRDAMLTSHFKSGDFWHQKREVQKKCQKDARVNGDCVTYQHARPSSCCVIGWCSEFSAVLSFLWYMLAASSNLLAYQASFKDIRMKSEILYFDESHIHLPFSDCIDPFQNGGEDTNKPSCLYFCYSDIRFAFNW